MRTAATGERKETRDQAHKHDNPGLVAGEILKGAAPPNHTDWLQGKRGAFMCYKFFYST